MSLLLEDLREELLDRLDGLQLRLQVGLRAWRRVGPQTHSARSCAHCNAVYCAGSSKPQACYSTACVRLQDSRMQVR